MLKPKKLNIHTAQGFSGELSRESQFVFNYRTSNPELTFGRVLRLTGIDADDGVCHMTSVKFEMSSSRYRSACRRRRRFFAKFGRRALYPHADGDPVVRGFATNALCGLVLGCPPGYPFFSRVKNPARTGRPG